MNKEIVLNLWHVVAEKDGALYVIGFLGKEYELEGNDDEKLKYLTAKASTDFDCPTVNIPVPNTYIMADATSGAEMKGVIPFSAFNVMPMNFKIRAYEEVISAIEEKCNIKISDDPLVCTTPIKLIDGVLTRIPIDKVVRTGS